MSTHSAGPSSVVLAVVTLLCGQLVAQEGTSLTEIAREIAVLRVEQVRMNRDISIIRDLLLGRQPSLDGVALRSSGMAWLGNPDARVVLVEFSDYACPYCGEYARKTYPRIVQEYVKTGRVSYAVRNFPLEQAHPFAEKAAEAAECAGTQGKYWEMRDRLFANQTALKRDDLGRYAEALGLDRGVFDGCLDAGRSGAKIRSDQEEGSDLYVRATPTFFVARRDLDAPFQLRIVKAMNGAQPFEVFVDALEKALRQ